MKPLSELYSDQFLRAHQMPCLCSTLRPSSFTAALDLLSAFFFSFAILVGIGPSPVFIAVCIWLLFLRILILEFVLFGFLVSSFFVRFDGLLDFRICRASTANCFKGACGLLEGTAEFELPSSSANKR